MAYFDEKIWNKPLQPSKTTAFHPSNPITKWTDTSRTSASYFPDSANLMLIESKQNGGLNQKENEGRLENLIMPGGQRISSATHFFVTGNG